MKTLLRLAFLLAVLVPPGVHAVEDSMVGSRIVEIGSGRFSYSYFNYRPDLLAFFESKGLQGGGYTWEALAKAGLELSGSEYIGRIEFDSEGDALFATSAFLPALNELEAMVKRLADDPAFRGSCIALALESGELE